ncbi:hypothetical protein BH11PSE11_BH11PSE11_19810 [soil metagenome]
MTIAFNLIAEHSSDAITVLDHDWRYLYSNYRAELLMRKSKGEFAHHSHWEIFPELLGTPAEADLRRAMSNRVTLKFEQFIPRLYAWHSVRAVPIDGGLALYTTDITDRVRAARDEVVRAEVRKLFEDIPVAIAITRGKDHRIEMLNSMARKLAGNREIEGLTARAAFPEMEGQGYFELLDQVYQTGTRYEARAKAVTFPVGDGKPPLLVYFDIVYLPLFEIGGEVSGILSMRRDVTHRIVNNERHQQARAERAAILTQLEEGVIVADLEGRITFANDVANRLHGVDQLVGTIEKGAHYALLTDAGEILPPSGFPLLRAASEGTVTEKTFWRIRRPDGTVVRVEGSALPVVDKQGNRIAAVMVVREKPDKTSA